jgi:Putative DNA-binding domain
MSTTRQTLGELRRLQRLAGSVIMRPLARDWRMQRRWTDQRDMRAVTAQFIKPNDRLSSFERIEIYNRQYWFRLIDTFYEDFPGLRAILGRLKFNRLAKAYLTAHPSRSFTLRNLGQSLPQFVERNPKLVTPRYELAIDMARFEWAQVEAFDGPARPPVTVDDLLGNNPQKIRLALQPYLSLLRLRYPLDDYVIRLKKDGLRGEASNAVEETLSENKKAKRRAQIPRPREVFVVVHRYNNSLYYRRIDRRAFAVLTALQKGATLGRAVDSAFSDQPDPKLIRQWFQTWTELGWFCKPARSN